MTVAQPFVSGALPTRRVRTSFTTLFDVAKDAYGDARYWTVIAIANNLTDPWLNGFVDIVVPPLVSTATPSGIIGA